MKTKIAALSTSLALFIPFTAQAACTSSANNICNLNDLVGYLKGTINSLIPLLFGIALVVFIWGVIKYMNADGPVKMAEARNYIIFSILAITVMLSVWGIALVIKNTFFGNANSPLDSSSSNTSGLNNQLDPGNELGAGGNNQIDSSANTGNELNVGN